MRSSYTPAVALKVGSMESELMKSPKLMFSAMSIVTGVSVIEKGF